MALIVEKLVGIDLSANALNIIREIREFGRGVRQALAGTDSHWRILADRD